MNFTLKKEVFKQIKFGSAEIIFIEESFLKSPPTLEHVSEGILTHFS